MVRSWFKFIKKIYENFMKSIRFIGAGLILGASALLPLVASAADLTSFIQLTGEAASDVAGRSLATGDVNGDGYDDLVIGAIHPGGDAKVYLIYGQSSQFESKTLSSSNITFSGASSGDQTGISVAVGDTDADGYDDIVIGSNNDDGAATDAGAVYIMYGQATALTSQTLSAAVGVKFTGEAASDKAGISIAVADFNGDTYADVLVGALGNDDVASASGAAYLISGQASRFTGTVSLGIMREYTGEAASNFLGQVVGAGDIDGNGTADMLLAAPGNSDGAGTAGAVYVVYTSSGNSLPASTESVSTLPEFTGEALLDNLGSGGVIGGDLNGDGYDELIIGTPGNDSNGSGAGAVHVIQGSANQYTAAAASSVSTVQLVEYDGEGTSGAVGTSVAAADLNNDGYDELVIGATGANNPSTGTTYIVGGAATLTGGNIGAVMAVDYDGANASDSFGRWVTTGDLNGDGFPELVASAGGYLSGASTGAVYIGYLTIDADHDGVAGSSGILNVGTDCNDSDATVATDVTFYPDADGDGLGNPDGTTTTSCTTTLDGYADNANDTDDTIPNNGVEIDGDEVDNDGDTEIDEHNTIAENGTHPYYGTKNAANNSSNNITSVVGRNHGKVTVTYADNSIYDYTVFTTDTTKTTKVQQYKATGYAVVLKKNGTKAILLDLYTGDKVDNQDLASSAAVSASMLLDDVRNDGSTEAVFTTKTKSTVKIFLVRVKKSTGKLSLYDKLTVHHKNVDTSKTRTHKKKLQLRNDSSKVLVTIDVNKNYVMSEEAAG